MASYCTPLVLLSVACVCYVATPAASQKNCSVANCKVLPVGDDLESEFRQKASEKGVRIIYLNLKIGNRSYNPLELPDEIFPERWMWAASNNEPMLSLPIDFDVLSLGLLNFQVRRMRVPLRDEPSGCLAGLNSTCQNLAVGRALLDNNITKDSTDKLSRKAGVVCVIMIEKNPQLDHRSIKYHCCSLNASGINCNLPIRSSWFKAIGYFVIFLSNLILLCSPALLLLLPDCIFNLQHEFARNNNIENQLIDSEQAERIADGYQQQVSEIQNGEEELPVDDASPITCSTLLLGCVQQLPGLRMSFNLKLAVLLFCIYPFPIYIQLGLLAFIVKVVGFTIMGLVLNVEIITPYVAFLVVVITNVYFCYANLQRSYIEVKEFILKYWQQGSETTSSSQQNTIPAKLFWLVSNKVLPVKTEICLMFRNMAVIVTFLFLTICSIIFFGNEYDISTLVSTIAVFISGAIPSLFFKGLTGGKKLTGWRKIKLEREIEAVVKEKKKAERSPDGMDREREI